MYYNTNDGDEFYFNCYDCRKRLTLLKTRDFIQTYFKEYDCNTIDRSGVFYRIMSLSLNNVFVNAMLFNGAKNSRMNIIETDKPFRYDLCIRWDNPSDSIKSAYLKFISDPAERPDVVRISDKQTSAIDEKLSRYTYKLRPPKHKLHLHVELDNNKVSVREFKFSEKNIHRCAHAINLDWTHNIGICMDNTKYFCDPCRKHEQAIFDYIKTRRKDEYIDKIDTYDIGKSFPHIPKSIIENIAKFSGRLDIIKD